MKSMKFKWLIPIVSSAVIVYACTRSVSDRPEDAQPGEAAQETDAVVSEHGMPESPGAYLYRDGAFVRIEDGASGMLMPTNAERGFGFAKPAGTRLEAGGTEFSVVSGALHAEQLQITRFEGVATATAEAYVRVDNTNTAWIPAHSVKAALRVIDADSGFSEISLESPIEPGFYVLHDETLFRAHVADEVTGFYPFIVTEEDKTEWQRKAETCFNEAHKLYGDMAGSPLDAPKGNADAQKGCISALRLYWKSGDAGRDIEKQLVYMGRVTNPKSGDTHQKMLGFMDATQNDLAADLWKIEQADQMYRLASLSAGDKPAVQEGVLAYYGLPVKGALKNLAWVPFVEIAFGDGDTVLAGLFEKILNSEDYTKPLVRILGGLHYDYVHRSVLGHAHLNSWFKKFDNVTPTAFKTAASELKVRVHAEDVAIGPYRFQNVPEEEHSAWKAAVSSKLPDIRRCISKGDAPHGALLLVSQPLNGTGFGREITGTLREVGNEDNKISSISQGASSCILKVFGSLPSEPALDSSQRLQVAIAIRK